MFDLSQQDDLLGKQGSSSTWPCSKCFVTKDHLQNHGGKEHSLSNCKKETAPKDYSFFKDSLQEVTRHTNIKQQCADVGAVDNDDEFEVLVQSLEDRRKEAKNYGNVISIILMQFESLDDMVDPLMHILMGLTNDNLNEIKKECQRIDGSQLEDERDEREIFSEKLFEKLEEKQQAQNHYSECSRELKGLRENIYPLIIRKKIDEALKIAIMDHKVKLTKENKKKKREPCQSSFCLLFPIDIQQGYGRTIECITGCEPHTLCEGLSDFSDAIQDENLEYMCNKCAELSTEEIDAKFRREIEKLEEAHKNFL